MLRQVLCVTAELSTPLPPPGWNRVWKMSRSATTMSTMPMSAKSIATAPGVHARLVDISDEAYNVAHDMSFLVSNYI